MTPRYSLSLSSPLHSLSCCCQRRWKRELHTLISPQHSHVVHEALNSSKEICIRFTVFKHMCKHVFKQRLNLQQFSVNINTMCFDYYVDYIYSSIFSVEWWRDSIDQLFCVHFWRKHRIPLQYVHIHINLFYDHN